MSVKVLIIEDSLTVRMNLHEALEDAGIAVESCATLGEGRRALQAETFALVILDMILPDGEGIDLLREIKASPARNGTAVILLAVEAAVRDRLAAMGVRADDYIAKPYDTDTVVARIGEMLAASIAPPPPPAQSAPTVLVIDDSLTFRITLKDELETAGYKVLTAESGEAGLRLAGQLQPSAMIVDGIMEGIDGATVIRRVRLDAVLRHIPCLLLTASEGKSAEIEALDAGADAFVVKNEDASLVLARLSAILRSAAASRRPATPNLQAPKRVLAVDDSETYLQEVAGSLRGEGYEVVLGRSGEEALDIVAVQQVDCILLDLVMPGLGGHEVCRRLKANSLTRHIPVLILTSRDDRESTIEGLSAGADDYVAKSSEFQVLRARVLAQLRRKQFEDENRRTREQILHRELEATEARAAREVAEARAALVEQGKLRAEASERAKSAFLATMSHELRTPMGGVIGVVELLAATNLSAEQRQMVDIIRKSGVTLLDVINGILDYSKIEVGGLTMERTPFSLVDVVEVAAQLAAAQAQSKPVEVTCYIDPAIDEAVMGDPMRVRQVALNIMGNAVKFTDSGQVRVEVIAETFTDEEMTVLFEVSDSGIGMTPAEQERLFQPYRQASDATARRFGGTGLGLSICKNLVELMGGQIGTHSVIGRGSTFWFRLKFERALDQTAGNHAAGNQTAAGVEHAAVLRHLRVLVFCPKGQAVATLYLRAKEVEVLESTDFQDALRALEAEARAHQPLDLFILHTGHGVDVLAQVQALRSHPLLKGTKCIVVAPQMSAEHVASGEDTYVLSSPIHRAQLYDVVAFSAGRIKKRALTEKGNVRRVYMPPSVDDARAQGALVLVAEDSKTNQFVIASQLKNLGIACEIVADGREAWSKLENDGVGYGLLLTDCHMPHVDGYKLAALVRDREIKTGRHLPIVALTANALVGEAEICRASGMDDYLSKPTNLATLEGALKQWLPGAMALRRDTGQPVKTRAAAGASDAAPIILARFSDICPEGTDSFARYALSVFRETEAGTPQQIAGLIDAGNSAALAGAAHAALGAARVVCAPRLADLFEDLEKAARLPDWAEIGLLRPQIETEFRAVMSFIDRHVAEPAP